MPDYDSWRGEICGIENCRSTRYHIEDALTYCSNGHQTDARPLNEHDDFVGAGSRTTKKRREAKVEISKILDGKAAIELYLQCFQLILRKQVKWLIEHRNYSNELENVVRDLWSLRMQMFNHLLDTDRQDGVATVMFSSQSGAESSEKSASFMGRRARSYRDKQAPRMIESLCLIYLGIVLLRLPVCAADVRDWVLDEGFVYLQPQKALPKLMLQRLPDNMRRRLAVLTGAKELVQLPAAVIDLEMAYRRKFDMQIPDINHHLLLLRFMRELALPIDCFPAVCRLGELVEYKFDFGLSKGKTGTRRPLGGHPEVKLICLLVVVVKTFYPFDNLDRYPRRSAEPSALSIDWDFWRTHQKVRRSSTALRNDKSQAALDTREADVLSMTGQEMDDYLDWFGRTWTESGDIEGTSNDAAFLRQLYGMFPVQIFPKQDKATGNEMFEQNEALKDSQFCLNQRDIVAADGQNQQTSDIRRPGSYYKRYRNVDQVPIIAKPFFQAASALVGLPIEDLVREVFRLEIRVQKLVELQQIPIKETEDIEGG